MQGPIILVSVEVVMFFQCAYEIGGEMWTVNLGSDGKNITEKVGDGAEYMSCLQDEFDTTDLRVLVESDNSEVENAPSF